MRVLLVEDSRAVRAYVEAILRDAGDIVVLPSAVDGREAIERATRERPDVILMDLEIPELDGLSCIRAIMDVAPCPIVVLSAYVVDRAHPKTFEAFEAGAVDVMRKPEGLSPDAIDRFRGQLLRTVRAMAGARVVRRNQTPRRGADGANRPEFDAVAIGSSTGGPPIVHRVLAALGAPPPFPIVVAQHIVVGFERSFVDWLATSGTPVVLAEDGMELEPGRVYVLRSDVLATLDARTIRFLDGNGRGLLPSIDGTFVELARVFGARALGILLSGMGTDGASGALRLRAAGGEVWTQLGSTCVVDGIPAAAREIGASSRELAPDRIASELARIARLPERTG